MLSYEVYEIQNKSFISNKIHFNQNSLIFAIFVKFPDIFVLLNSLTIPDFQIVWLPRFYATFQTSYIHYGMMNDIHLKFHNAIHLCDVIYEASEMHHLQSLFITCINEQCRIIKITVLKLWTFVYVNFKKTYVNFSHYGAFEILREFITNNYMYT